MISVFDLNIRHLGVALAVKRCGSISAASAFVNLSQPAVTQAVANLEEAMEQRLFNREPRGAVATDAGNILLDRIEAALNLITTAAVQVRRAARLTPIAHFERIIAMAQLRALIAVEQAGSYALAARQIGLAQPTVHRATSEIELLLGVPLLMRTGRTISSTAAGERMVRAIRLAMAELQGGIDDLQALSRRGAGQVRIGTLSLPPASLLPKALARFSRTHPHASVTVTEGIYEELLAELRNGGIDLLLGALRDPVPVKDIVQRPLFVDDLSIVCAVTHPLAGTSMPAIRELAGFPWIIGGKGAPVRRNFEAMFPSAGDRPETCIEAGSILIARGLLLEDNWLSLMSHDQFRMEKALGLLTTIGAPLPASHLNMGVTTRADWRPTTTQQAMMAALQATAAQRTAG